MKIKCIFHTKNVINTHFNVKILQFSLEIKGMVAMFFVLAARKLKVTGHERRQ